MAKDIIIIGAGVAGLLAAEQLAAAGYAVTILEARDRLGGRIHTFRPSSFSVDIEEGAEFIHGQLPLTASLVERAAMSAEKVEGRLFEIRDGQLQEDESMVIGMDEVGVQIERLGVDMSVADFLQRYFAGDKYAELRASLTRYIEGYEAADTTRAGIQAMKGDLDEEMPDQYRPKQGYRPLVDYLAAEAQAKGCVVHRSAIAKQVHWEKDSVQVTTADGRHFQAHRLLITVPLGVLQHPQGLAGIHFSPALPAKQPALDHLGFGNVVKVVFEFSAPLWHDRQVHNGRLQDVGFLFSSEAFPTWWTQAPRHNGVITGWVGGPPAAQFTAISPREIERVALASLANILAVPVDELEHHLLSAHVANWNADPFSMGAYKYSVVNGAAAIAELNTPVDDTIFFAGEGCYEGPYNGTVEAALWSAVQAVKNILR